MDPKDLRSEATLGECINNGNSNYTQSTSTSTQTGDRNKTYHDIGSNSLGKVGSAAGRPCAVIGPDRAITSVPQPVLDEYHKRDHLPHWPPRENIYQQAPFYPQKSSNLANPQRNISPRQTFQENMQRIMVPPTYTKMNGDHNFLLERSDSIPKIAKSNETPKYCDVPFTVNPISADQKTTNSCEMPLPLPNVNSAYLRPQNHGWQQNGVIGSHPQPRYGSPDVYQYNDYTSCAVPTNMPYARPQRLAAEESIPTFAEHYYRGRNIRFEPYPPAKERYPPPRYDYINRYPTSFQAPSFPSHKFEMQKLPPSYPTHLQGTYIRDPALDGYQINTKPQINFNVPFPSQGMSSKYSPVPANSLQNKYYPYTDPNLNSSNSVQGTFDQRNKLYVDYKGIPPKGYPASQNYYMNELPRHMPKGQTLPNYSSNVHPLAYYRKDMVPAKTSEFLPTIKPNDAVYYSSLSRQHSTNMIGPYNTQMNNVNNHQYRRLPEDLGYAPQAHGPVFRNMNHPHHPMYNNYDPRFGPMMSSHMSSKFGGKSKGGVSEEKKNIDVRQFLQSWSEGDDEGHENANNGKEIIIQTSSNFSKQCDNLNNHEQLYVLGLVNVPSEELSKYEHIQKVSKLPDNIKGYTNIDLLNQFEEAIQSSSSNTSEMSASKKGNEKLRPDLPGRPVSPFDVEAKISQSVIHKDVGCNFEIRPCSPGLVNVQVAVPPRPLSRERTIEKVNNTVNIESKTLLPTANKNMGKNTNSESMAINDDLNVSSCGKAITSEVKLPYSMHDLESNSGVCLASLPRLDNDIELNFPEVNQQFINANKQECVSLAKMTEFSENQTLSESNETCSRDYSKLIKYRKSKCAENEPFTVPIRTDSVIKNNHSVLENISYDANRCIQPLSPTHHNTGKTHPHQNTETNGDALNLTVSSTLGSVMDKIEINKPEILNEIAPQRDLHSAPSLGNDLPSYLLYSNNVSPITSVLADDLSDNSDKQTGTDTSEKNYDSQVDKIPFSFKTVLADDLGDTSNNYSRIDTLVKNNKSPSQDNLNKIRLSPINSEPVDDLGDNSNKFTYTDTGENPREIPSKDNSNDNIQLSPIRTELADALEANSNTFTRKNTGENHQESPIKDNSNHNNQLSPINSELAYTLGDNSNKFKDTGENHHESPSKDNSNANIQLSIPINSELANALGDNSNKFTSTDTSENNNESSSQGSSDDVIKFSPINSVLADDLCDTSNKYICTDTLEKNTEISIEVNSNEYNIQLSLINSELADTLGDTSNKLTCTDNAEKSKATKTKDDNGHYSQVNSNGNVQDIEIDLQNQFISNERNEDQDDIPETNDSIREYIENSSAINSEHRDRTNAIETQLNKDMCSNSKNNNKCDDIFPTSKQSSVCDEPIQFSEQLEGAKELEAEDFKSDEKCFQEVHDKNITVTEDNIADTISVLDGNKQNDSITTSTDGENHVKIDNQLYDIRDSEHCPPKYRHIEKSCKNLNRFWDQRLFSPIIQNLLFDPYKNFVLFRNMDNFIENSLENKYINVKDFGTNDPEEAKDLFAQDKDIQCENLLECPEALVNISNNPTELASKSVFDQENKPENFIAKNSDKTMYEDFTKDCNSCAVSEKTCQKDDKALNRDDSGTSQSCLETDESPTKLQPRILKRSLSESALSSLADKNSQYVNESCSEGAMINPSKRKRRSEEGETHIILDNKFGRVFHINRRNSISALCEDNVSFCIMIDDNCLVTEESVFENGTLCIANIDETIFESRREELDVQTKSPSELEHNSVEDKNSYVSCAEEDEEENWVEDIACVETVVSDETDYNNPLSPTNYSDTVGNIIDVDAIVNNTINESKEIFYNENSCFTQALYTNHSLSESTGDEVILVSENSSGVKRNCIEDLLSSSDSSLEGFDRNLIETGDSFDIFKEDVSSLIEDMTKEHLRKENYVEDVPSLIECKSPLVTDNMTSIFSSQFIGESKPYPTGISEDISKCLSSSSNYKSSSSSPEVTSTTSDDKKGISLKMTKHNGANTLEVNHAELCSSKKIRCKFTENEDYLNSRIESPVIRPLITKAAQKYIPPLKETIGDLKVKLRLPKDSLIKLRQLKHSKSAPSEMVTFKEIEKADQKLSNPNIVTKKKPKFEDVLKSIDEFQLKTSKDKTKKVKKQVPKVIIKKSENGSHYASRSNKDLFNPDLTGRKWQPWVFLEKNRFIDKMALRGKRSAVYCHRKKMFILKEKFRKYRSVNKYNTEFVISKKNENFSSCPLKYTIRLKKQN